MAGHNSLPTTGERTIEVEMEIFATIDKLWIFSSTPRIVAATEISKR
jgi:hypothetical protein